MKYLIKGCFGSIIIENVDEICFRVNLQSSRYTKRKIYTGEDIYTEVYDLLIETTKTRYRIKDCHRYNGMLNDIQECLSRHKGEEVVEIDLYDPLDEGTIENGITVLSSHDSPERLPIPEKEFRQSENE